MTLRAFAIAGEEGQAMAEYALLFALVTLAVFVAFSMFGLAVSRLFDVVRGVMS